jgi:hypothetical protein
MRNVLDKRCRENENTHFIMFNNFFSENSTVYEIMSKNVVETKGPQKTWQYGTYALCAGLARLHACMHMHAPTRNHVHTDQYVILIAFPQQKRFCERASMLRYTYTACLVPHIKGQMTYPYISIFQAAGQAHYTFSINVPVWHQIWVWHSVLHVQKGM